MDPVSPPDSHHHHGHHGDNDADLSFEALTFGEDSGHVKKEIKSAKKKAYKKEKYAQEEKEKGAFSVYVNTKEESEKIDVQSLLKKLEQFGVVKASYFKEKQNFGFIQFLDTSVVDSVVDAINKNPLFLSDGVHIIAERASAMSSHSASMGTSFSTMGMGVGGGSGTGTGAFPFSPSTPSMMAAVPSSSSLSTPSSSAPSTPSSSAFVTSPVIEKPDTILVLKNLPFSLKQDQLQEILLAVNSTAPQSINLHFDNMGVFRGMAFIKYRAIDDAIKVFEALNGYDVTGRKVRVEYKRKNKGQQQDIPPEWQDEDDLRRLWEQVRDFSANPNVNEISFTPNLTSNQRKHIHTMAEKLKLTHYSNGDADLRYICIKKAPPTPSTPSTPNTSSTSSSTIPSFNIPSSQNGFALPLPSNDRGIDIKGRRPRSESNGFKQQQQQHISSSPVNNGNGSFPNSNNNSNNNSISNSVEKEYRPRGNSLFKKDFGPSTPSDSTDWRIQSPRNMTPSSSGSSIAMVVDQSGQSPSQSQLFGAGGLVMIVPQRQPKGPDGSKGFADHYQRQRQQHQNQHQQPSFKLEPLLEIPAMV